MMTVAAKVGLARGIRVNFKLRGEVTEFEATVKSGWRRIKIRCIPSAMAWLSNCEYNVGAGPADGGMMTYRGRVKNGVVVVEGDPPLAEGDEVRVEVDQDVSREAPTWAETFRDVIGKAEGLPSDSSRNHDHYLYQTPKK